MADRPLDSRPLLAAAAVAAVELALARLTGGPRDVAELAASLVFVLCLGAGLGWVARWGVVARAVAVVAPAVVFGAWAFAAPFAGRLAWEPVVAVLAGGVVALATREARSGRDAPWGPRQVVAAYGAFVGAAWLLLGLAGDAPALDRLALVAAVIAVGAAAGPFAPALALLALMPGAPSAGRGEAAGKRPDVVLITVDTLRADAALGMRSYRRIEEGGRAWVAQAPAPWTLPSLASLLTGTEPFRHGAGRTERGFTGIRPEVATLAERLAEAGYATAATVQSPFAAPAFGLGRGFQAFRDERVDYHVVPGVPYSNRARPLASAWLVPTGAPARLADVASLRHEGPLFLWVHFLDAHIPYRHAGDLDIGWRDARLLEHAEYGALAPLPDPRTLELLRLAYDHEVEVVDAAIERLLATLPPAPYGRIVVMTSDHGEAFGEHGGWEHGHTLYQELLAVPLAISGIPGLAGGDAGLIDVAPTVLAAVGLPAPGLDGRDLREAEKPAYRSVNPLYGDMYRRAVKRGTEKLIASDRAQRFDLAADPGETRPLPSDAALEAMLPPRELGGGGDVDLADDVGAGLRALGYLEP